MDLTSFGYQGHLISDFYLEEDVRIAISALNTIHMHEEMYPSLPFLPFSFCDINDVKCVIIGGMPNMSNIEKWTGSAYSYDIKNHKTLFHNKVIKDLNKGIPYFKDVESDNYRLQDSGILMLHETMSVSRNNFMSCATFWTPIIFRLLNYISINDASVPIVFTTKSAKETYRLAVLLSENVFSLNLKDADSISENPFIFNAIQVAINNKRGKDKVDLLKLISI